MSLSPSTRLASCSRNEINAHDTTCIRETTGCPEGHLVVKDEDKDDEA